MEIIPKLETALFCFVICDVNLPSVNSRVFASLLPQEFVSDGRFPLRQTVKLPKNRDLVLYILACGFLLTKNVKYDKIFMYVEELFGLPV